MKNQNDKVTSAKTNKWGNESGWFPVRLGPVSVDGSREYVDMSVSYPTKAAALKA